MSEETDMEVETKPVEAVEEPAAVVEEPEAVVVEEAVEPAVVPKNKRKRSEAQVNALAAARKSKMSKMSSSKKKPVKIERKYAETPISDFSWRKEICKASILASLGLASIYVQQKCAQTPPPEVVQVEEKPKKKPSVKTGGKDPFAAYR
jgi:hypothetical protein